MVIFNSYVSLPQGTPFGCFCASLHCGLTIWISHLSFWSTNHHHFYPGWDRSCFRKRSSQLWFDLEAQWRMSVCPSLRLAILGATMTSYRKSGAQEHRTTLSAVKFCSWWSRTPRYFWCLERGFLAGAGFFAPKLWPFHWENEEIFDHWIWGMTHRNRWFTVLKNGDCPWQTVK